jgi:hypothetical protein
MIADSYNFLCHTTDNSFDDISESVKCLNRHCLDSPKDFLKDTELMIETIKVCLNYDSFDEIECCALRIIANNYSYINKFC